MAFSGPGTIRATTPTGAVEVPASDLKSWILSADALAPLVVTDATTYTVLVGNSGRIHVFPDLTASCTATLPAPAAGLNYTFWYGGAAADAHDWVITTASDTNYFVGGVVFLDQDGDAISGVYADGNSNSKLTVVKPEVGTEVRVRSDGTLWYLNGRVHSVTVPALADQ